MAFDNSILKRTGQWWKFLLGFFGGAVFGILHYTYDLLGNLKAVDLPDGRYIDYLVDGLGRRVRRTLTDGATTYEKTWVYQDALNPVAELDEYGNMASRFVYGTKFNVPDYFTSNKEGSWTTYRIISDHLGSPRLIVRSDDGAVRQQIDYDEYGQATMAYDGTGLGFDFQPFGFAGGLYDAETGLVRFGARDYDPETGRWTAKDAILFEGGDTNLYGYCKVDPVNRIDISGRKNIIIHLVKVFKNFRRISMKTAIAAVERGEDVAVQGKAAAKNLAKKTSHGGTPIFDEAHVKGGREHWHPNPRNGSHIFIDEFLLLLFDATGNGEVNYVDVFEFANPLPWMAIDDSLPPCA